MTDPAANPMNATTCYTVLGIFFSLCILTAALRFYTRLCLLRKFSADDYLLLIGLLLLIPYTGLYGRVIYHLFNRPYEGYTLQIVSNLFKYSFIMMPLYLTASVFVKLSIALRVLSFTSEAPVLRWIIIVVNVFYTASVIAMIAINLTRCLEHIWPWARPLHVAWGRHCVGPDGFRIANWLFSAMTCFVDFTLATLPWFIVQKLWTTSRRTKIVLSILLGLGSIASLATIARMFYTYKFAEVPDPTTAGYFYLWLYLELTLATIACSVATLKPLVVKLTRGPTIPLASSPSVTSTTSSTWSQYLRQFLVGDSEMTLVHHNMTSTPASPHQQWPPHLTSSTPRVLRHPSSMESIKRMSLGQRLFGFASNRTSESTSKRTTNSVSDTSTEDLKQSARMSHNRRAYFEMLNAGINYALQDEENHLDLDAHSLSTDSERMDDDKEAISKDTQN